jgi:hypothetical protein
MNELYRIMGDETVFYDIGAHFGIFTKLVFKFDLRGNNIHAFEPDYFNFRILQKNAEFCPHLNRTRVTSTSGDRAVVLDEYASQHESPDIVKMDIQGAELDALRGMQDFIKEHDPMLFIEVHPTLLPRFDSSLEELVSFLNGVGYAIEAGDHRQEPISWQSTDRMSAEEHLIKASK